MKYEWTVKKELNVTEDMIDSMAEDIQEYRSLYGHRTVLSAARAIVEDSIGYELDTDDTIPEWVITEITNLVVKSYKKVA